MHLSFLHKIRHNLDHLPDPKTRVGLLGIATCFGLHQGGWRRSLSEDSAPNAVPRRRKQPSHIQPLYQDTRMQNPSKTVDCAHTNIIFQLHHRRRPRRRRWTVRCSPGQEEVKRPEVTIRPAILGSQVMRHLRSLTTSGRCVTGWRMVPNPRPNAV